MAYGDRYLGKETVLCKDTPAFIANRIGVYSIISGMHAIEKMGFGVSEVDKLTGPVIGRAKSATFRTMDVVGLDTTVNVSNNLYKALPHDESRDKFKLPKIVEVLAAVVPLVNVQTHMIISITRPLQGLGEPSAGAGGGADEPGSAGD